MTDVVKGFGCRPLTNGAADTDGRRPKPFTKAEEDQSSGGTHPVKAAGMTVDSASGDVNEGGYAAACC
jgi:hypothetical protein